MRENIIRVKSKKRLLAVIIKDKYRKSGIEFLVPDNYPQQLGYMNNPKGYIIDSHIHPLVLRKIKHAQEVLFIRRGRIRVDFYDENKHYVESRIVEKGDVVFLASGGHGFEFLTNAEIIEVKQGPFLKSSLPVRLKSSVKERIKLKK